MPKGVGYGAARGTNSRKAAKNNATAASRIGDRRKIAEAQNQRAAAQGALTADMAERKGEAGVQTLEAQRQANLLSMQAAVSASAASNLGQAQANQMSALVAGNQLQAQMAANQMNALNQLGQTYLLTQGG